MKNILWAYVFSSLGRTSRSGIAVSHGNSMFDMLRHCQTVFPGKNKEKSTPGECQERCPGWLLSALQELLNGLDQIRRQILHGKKPVSRPNPCLPPTPPAPPSHAIPECRVGRKNKTEVAATEVHCCQYQAPRV